MIRKNNIIDRIAKPTPVEAKKNAKILVIVSVISALSETGLISCEKMQLPIIGICLLGALYNSQKVIK